MLWLALLPSTAQPAEPIRLHPDNPHYLLFHGKPTILLTSGEHYGAVLNRDFDYVRYLDALQAAGFNLTRTFAGTYREVPGSFGIIDNTLAPVPGAYLCPWARGAGQKSGDGLPQFDLTRFDPIYSDRLKEFVVQAAKRGIIVELSLFCSVYDDKLWSVNPMNAMNNEQAIGKVDRLEIYTLKNKDLTAVQDGLVRKMVATLKDCDNLYYEVCNEPYFGGVTKEWTDHIVATIADAEKNLPTRHLIAQNIANGSAKIDRPSPNVSIFNFHYAAPPDAVGVNYSLNRVIADDETGFRGQDDRAYRTEAWDFFVAGGGIFSNLDYSFSCKQPDGTAVVTTSPGGGGLKLRKQLRILKGFMEGIDFTKMRPDNSVIRGGSATAPLAGNPPEARVTARALVEPGRAYAIYVKGGTQAELHLTMPAGKFMVEWINTKTGNVEKSEALEHSGGEGKLASPPYAEDIALRIQRLPWQPRTCRIVPKS
jgi:hypothetical protein